MPRMNPMEAVVRVLEDEGVKVAFGVPGAAILPLYDAMRHSSIRHLSVRHEEGGTHAADGWARVTGEPGICIGTSGPAGTNMITGLYTAQADSIPMICITGQANTNVLHKEAFQAVDIVDIAKPVCKWAYQVKETAQLPWAFREAFRDRARGPPRAGAHRPAARRAEGPGHRVRPRDRHARWPFTTPAPNAAAIDRALELLEGAERPLILAGGGVIVADASEELVALAEELDIPVSPTLMGKGAIRRTTRCGRAWSASRRPSATRNQIFLESDVVLAIGARFGDRHTGDLDVYRGDRKFIHIDISPEQIGARLPGRPGHRRRRQARARGARRAGGERRRARRETWVGARRRELEDTLARRTDFDDVADQAAARLPGAQRALRPGHDLRDRDRPVPDLERPVPDAPTSRATTSAAGRPARWAGRSPPASGPSSPRPTSWWSASSATTPSSS